MHAAAVRDGRSSEVTPPWLGMGLGLGLALGLRLGLESGLERPRHVPRPLGSLRLMHGALEPRV